MTALPSTAREGERGSGVVKRLSAKIFVESGYSVDQAEVVPVFHQWIQTRALGQLLIDVADYRHVHHGPGVMLIAHEGHYAMDTGEGRLGLMFRQSRWNGLPPHVRIERLLCTTVAACRRLERDLPGRIRFCTGEFELRVTDRLTAPNTPETVDRWRAWVMAVLAPIADLSSLTVRSVQGEDVRLHVTTRGYGDAARFLDRLCIADSPH